LRSKDSSPLAITISVPLIARNGLLVLTGDGQLPLL